MMSFWVSLAASGIAAYPLYRWLLAIKSRQTVSQYVQEHAHKQGTPTMGGLIILVGLLAGILWMLPQEALAGSAKAALVLLLGFGLIGFVDDYVVPKMMVGKRGLGWTPKLAMQIGFAVIAGLVRDRAMAPVDFGIFVFLVLFFSNAYNFSDGLDALAGSLLIGMAIALMGLGLLPGAPFRSDLALAMIGAVIPYLALNAPPAKVFMGDVGALPIGALLGLVAAASLPDVASGRTFHPFYILPLVCWAFMMIVELVPVPLQIFWVKVFKKRLFPMTPIHHAFQRAGWPETRIVWMFFLAQIVFSFAALSLHATLVPPR